MSQKNRSNNKINIRSKTIIFTLICALLFFSGKACLACRIMAFANSSKNIDSEDNDFRLKFLLKNKNSFKNQSKIRTDKNGNAFNPFDYEDLYGLRQLGNMDGWGIMGFNGQTFTHYIEKGTIAAFKDANFDKSVNNIINKKSEIILTHIRLASCGQVNINNVHPFTYKSWGFVHNGTVPGALSKPMQDKIKEYSKILGESPKGTTDSESSLYYFMSKLQEKYGTTDSEKIGKENLKTTFAEMISDLIENSTKSYHELDGNVLGVKGKMATVPSCNFITSDGKYILAYHRGPGLYLGEKTLKSGKKEYIISSEKQEDKATQWLEIPQNHMLILSKDNTSNFVPEIEPMSMCVKKEVL